MEPFAAILTGVGPGVGVDQKMGGESTGALERFPTLFTLEHLFHTVHSPEKGILFNNTTRNLSRI